MPTENRSSNTEMVSVPRLSLEAARDCLVICQDQAFQSCECESCPQCGLMPDECTDTECSKTCQCTTCEHCMNKDSIDSLAMLLSEPAPQPHPEPIAWMVGTAFWWTKEEAERDAAETGKAIVPFGPMTGTYTPVEQHQGEPVAWMYTRPEVEWPAFYDKRKDAAGWKETPLYTHADPGEIESLKADKQAFAQNAIDLQQEVERLRAELIGRNAQVVGLRAQLAKQAALLRAVREQGLNPVTAAAIRVALSASAEPEVKS